MEQNDAAARGGAWIQTYTGRQFWPLDGRPEEVEIEDIAHSLGMLCRFNGHCRRFYSVAEHSVWVSRLVEEPDARWGLLHDAAEAYLSDLPKPLKRVLPDFDPWEERLLGVIAVRFGLTGLPSARVKEADWRLLANEKATFMAPEPSPWHGLPAPFPDVALAGWSPEEAKARFLERYRELFPLA
ncbi:MAG: phosphohydrolase [Magnetococcales bacterium]|nr:phosphohydrolase [Magnetococcales bacterium]MBF0260538.1 phosphohydrolase [Magnetococcales bacterium]